MATASSATGRARMPSLVPSPLSRVERTGDLPLSFAQQRLWFIDQFEPGSGAYNMSLGVRLRGKVREGWLRQSLDEIIRRHEALRTTFPVRDGVPVQEIAAEAHVAMEVVDLRQLSSSERELEAGRLTREEAEKPFDLSDGPLLRVKLFRLSDDDSLLMTTMHHIISDGWSCGVLVREFTQSYQAYAKGSAPTLPELKLQYADFAVWQRKWFQGDVLENQRENWRRQLQEARVLELPTDHPRAAARPSRGATHEFQLLPAVSAGKLKEVCRKEDATLFMALLACWQLALSRYAAQADVVVGTAIANRNRVEIEPLIGLFVNSLALRTRVEPSLSFRQLLGAVRQVTLDAYRHQDLPFEMVVEDFGAQRDATRNPLFDTMLVLQNTPPRKLALPGLELEEVRIDTESTRLDLMLYVEEHAGQLKALLKFDASLYEACTMERLLGHFHTALEKMANESQALIGETSLLSAPERRQLLEEWNQTSADFPASCVHALFEEQVRRQPEAVAVIFEATQLTYRELNSCTNLLARYLQRLGAGPEMRVAVCMERSVEMVVALLAVLKAGAAYVPLDPDYPQDRLAYMLADAQASVVLIQQKLAKQIPLCPGTVVAVDASVAQISQESPENLSVYPEPENAVYVIYTSGSTGLPKGAVNTHRGLTNRLWWMQETYRLNADDCVLQKTPFSFDVSVWEFFWPLISGARLVVARPQGHRDPDYLAAIIQREKVSTLHFVPSMLAAFLSAQGLEQCTSIRRVICSGEALSTEVAKKCLERLPAALHNLYGPTEAAIDVTWWPCEPGVIQNGVRIGKPIANTQVYVLDEQMMPAPIGAPGELYLGGVGLARGYWNRPELTAEKFVANPFSVSGGRLYRTGDWVRYRDNGDLEFLGRIDQQVKVRGHRIELGEIEAVLEQHPDVLQAAVAVRSDPAAEKHVVAYVVGKAAPGELRAYLRQKLPDPMVPAFIVPLAGLPLTPNGKIDRKALPEPAFTESNHYVGPRDGNEEVMAAIFRDVLKLDRVGVEDNFFDLGGHSLMATQIVARVRSLLGVELPLRTIFEAPTVAELAVRVRAVAGNEHEVVPAIRRARQSGGFPLSFAQQRMWFVDQLEPGNSLYNMPMGLRLSGELDSDALARSLNEIVQRHDVLRTAFPVKNGAPVQAIAAEHPLVLERVDLRQLEGAERELAVRKMAQAEIEGPFDLAHGPLLRTKLLQLADEEHILLLTMHHIVSDGWSIGVVLREFAYFYTAYVKGEKPSLPDLEIQYADFAVWHREWVEGEVLDRQLGYWQKQLADVPVLELLPDHPRTQIAHLRGGAVPFRLEKEFVTRFRELCRREGATLFMGLLVAYQVLLSKYAAQQDFAIGTVVANRASVETEKLIGLFLNTLALRADLSCRPDFREVMKRARQVALDAYRHQDMPFERLIEVLSPERQLGRSPLIQTMFALQNTEQPHLHLPNLRTAPFDPGSGMAKFEVALVLSEREGAISGTLPYAKDLYEEATIQRMLEHLRVVLEMMVKESSTPVDEISLLTEREQEQVLMEWNRTSQEIATVWAYELVEQRAKERPEAAAVVNDGRVLSYGELNTQANKLAWYLMKKGVGREKRVAICMERSGAMLVAQLAVWKSGGAYLPLDGEYPQERLRYMVEDAGAEVVLVDKRYAAAVGEISGRGIVWEQEWKKINEESGENPRVKVEGEELAYLIYTSGSTGQPKGVMVTHAGLANLLRWYQEAYGVKAEDRTTQLASCGFDASVWETWPYLTAGASVYVVGDKERLQGKELLEWIGATGITVGYLPTPLVEMTLQQGWAEGVGERSGGKLRFLLTGGDKLHRGEWRTFPFRLMNNYGPSENTVVTSYGDVEENGEGDPGIGRPIRNTQVYVLDEGMRPVPVGVAGELYIGGVGLSRGYLGRAELTGERFVPNPFAHGVGGERLYRSGDRVRWRISGELEYLGRTDQQVKIRGYRIELGEIEALLRQIPEIREAVLIAREDMGPEKCLVAYIAGKREEEVPDTDKATAYLKERVPGYMVPARMVVLKELPVTAHGKLDRKALPKPERGDEGTLTPPRNAVEEVLCGIWAEVLNVPQVGIESDFFELGGHSLMATRCIARVRTMFNVHLPMRALFEAPTVAAFAGFVRQAQEQIAAENNQSSHDGKNAGAQIQSLASRKDLELESALAELEDLSEEEVQRLLSAES